MHRLLIVDDHPENTRPLVLLFGMFGIPAKTADSGATALAELAEHRPEVVLLDVMMPEMDGFAVLTAIRAEPRYERVAVVMHTALGDSGTRDRSRRLGAQGHVIKGTGFDAVHAEVRRHLSAAGV